ncbi:hypothetical protein MalM25_01590 [Planctomycetes bacterium MalM25]|nr:hypothetical protein MalM25_01590 [Planctomycetes bacterium MalM25]
MHRAWDLQSEFDWPRCMLGNALTQSLFDETFMSFIA